MFLLGLSKGEVRAIHIWYWVRCFTIALKKMELVLLYNFVGFSYVGVDLFSPPPSSWEGDVNSLPPMFGRSRQTNILHTTINGDCLLCAIIDHIHIGVFVAAKRTLEILANHPFIKPIFIPPRMTGTLQPLDLHFFAPFKTTLKRCVAEFMIDCSRRVRPLKSCQAEYEKAKSGEQTDLTVAS